MTLPATETTVPAGIAALAQDDPVRPVWRNMLGGTTYAVGADRFVKYSPRSCPLDLGREAQRMRWAVRYADVPHVLATGADHGGHWLVTAALGGESAVSPRWLDDPLTAVRAIGRGLRRLHDRLPVELCPFGWSIRTRVARARSRGQHDPTRWFPEHRALDPREAFARLDRPPAVDRLVVSHGDPCAPNTLIGDDGGCVGQVDLGSLGVADRWADLAVATWSAEWNYGSGWEGALLDAYGIDPDPVRTTYFRLLWDLSP